jgi:hypothetical protein
VCVVPAVPRAAARRRQRVAASVMSAAALVIGLASCSSPRAGAEGTPPPVAATATPVHADDPCSHVSGATDCFMLPSGSWAAVNAPERSKGLVIVDLGGPGSFVSDVGDVRSGLPPWTADYTVGLLIDGWAGWQGPDLCLRHFARLSWGADDGVRDCDDYVSTYYVQPSVTASVDELRQRLDLDLVGVVAASFGVPRTRPLWSRLTGPQTFLIAYQPAPPVGTSASEVIDSRVERATQAIAAQWGPSCNPSAPCAALRQVLTHAAQDKTVALFLLGAGTEPDRYAALVSRIAAGQALTADDQATIRRVAASFSHTLDKETGLDSNLGFRAQSCQAYGAPDQRGAADPLVAALADQYGPCSPIMAHWPAATPSHVPEHSCLLLNSADPVVDPDWSEGLRTELGGSRVVTFSAASHAWPAEKARAIRADIAGWSCSNA